MMLAFHVQFSLLWKILTTEHKKPLKIPLLLYSQKFLHHSWILDCAIKNKYAGHVHGALFLRLLLCHKVDLQEKEQQKQQSIDEMRDKKTGLERTVELKRDMQGKKQQELRSVRAELQRLEGSSTRLQDLENELAKVVRVFCFAVNFNRWLFFG